MLGYVGLFEGGWLSDDARMVVRSDVGVSRVRFVVGVNPVFLNPGVPVRSVLVIDVQGQVLGKTQLVVGGNMIYVATPILGCVDVRLKSDSTMPLHRRRRQARCRAACLSTFGVIA